MRIGIVFSKFPICTSVNALFWLGWGLSHVPPPWITLVFWSALACMFIDYIRAIWMAS